MEQANAQVGNCRIVDQWLVSGGLRPTRQRVILARRLIGDGKNRHVTAESLFAASNDHDDKVSLATVYNTLRAFCVAGLMREITVDGAKSYFYTNMTDHPHFDWEESAEVVDAPAEQLTASGLPAAPHESALDECEVVMRSRRTP